jgi:hypothetical protein
MRVRIIRVFASVEYYFNTHICIRVRIHIRMIRITRVFAYAAFRKTYWWHPYQYTVPTLETHPHITISRVRYDIRFISYRSNYSEYYYSTRALLPLSQRVLLNIVTDSSYHKQRRQRAFPVVEIKSTNRCHLQLAQ